MPPGRWPWRALPVREERSSSIQILGGVAPARQAGRGGRAARRGSKRRALLGNTTPSCGACPAVPPPRSGRGDGARTRRRSGERRPQPGSQRGLPYRRGSRRPRRRSSRDGQPERAVELLLGSAGGEELVLIAGSPRARFLEVLARSRLALDRHAEASRAAWRRRLGLGRSAPDGCRLGRSSGGGRRSARRRPRPAAEQALMSAAAADQVGAPVEAALAHARGSRAPRPAERSCSRRARAGGR